MDSHETLKFLYLLERPSEPLYLGLKGHGLSKYLYNLPQEHLEPYQVQAMVELRKLIPSSISIVEVPVYKTRVPYDLTRIQSGVSKSAPFSEFSPKDMAVCGELVQILTSQSTRDDFFNACALCRDLVNTHLWIHALIKASARRQDMRGFRLPSIWELIPDVFIEQKIWTQGITQATLPENQRAVIVIDKNWTGTNLNPLHKVAYFTEDIGCNAHHFHWHVVTPFTAPKGSIDRKGELFYRMHHDMLSRYDTERLANGLNRVVPFDMHYDVLEEACFPKLSLQNSGMNFAGRQENSTIKDFNRARDPATNFLGTQTIANIRAWCDRIIEAVDAGFAIQETGGRIDLRTELGIDVVTAMWESSNDSPHPKYYGMSHNYGHSAIGLLHDPDFRYKEPPGVMYFPGTSMRDPAFFRWHKYLDSISQRQKDYLTPYTHETLQWNGIVINEIQMIRLEPSQVPMPNLHRVNNMVTHWMQSDIELSRGLDFGRNNINGLGSVWVRSTHLQHVPFTFRVRVTNQTRQEVMATVRIFMAPKLDENGDKMPFYEQRILFFEMDKFTVKLQPGENFVDQKSEDSNLTIPAWSQTFRAIERNVQVVTRANDPGAICGCGWPDYLYLPRGKVEGQLFDLFVMLTSTPVDQVASSRRKVGSANTEGLCKDSLSFCPLQNDKNPDSRPMGFPFDRPAIPNERSKLDLFLADFIAPVSNMASQEITIFHVNKTVLNNNVAPKELRLIHVTP